MQHLLVHNVVAKINLKAGSAKVISINVHRAQVSLAI
jgi:hypothetical protein